ncbi:ABC transporter permease subunit [Microcoleus sp. FACHB-68]|uniref:ABC transporter permease subunit n=1 Tax=Microcoleus sp. FACHB-68 TaxID=2692826 RepID=UPI001689E6FB|nr:ABC transporter permease subunit [Microcoleus sp. FACHB-68]MBD1938932.1 ABC transporter permease subunit [Microcoleus sp. FACHB-68]
MPKENLSFRHRHFPGLPAKSPKWLRRLALGLTCLLLLAGCVLNANLAGTPKTLKVATGADYPPFEFQAQNGELTGFDIELIQAIGKAENFKIEFESMPFDGIIPALQSRTVDAAICAMTITAERSKTISFSRPYFKAGIAIAIKTNNKNITSFDSLKNKTIAVQIGTIGAKKAKEIPGAKLRTYDSAPLALQALVNGNVDAAISDAPVTLYAIKQSNLKGIKIIDQLITEEFFGIPTPKNSPNLDTINKGLTTVLNNGTYAQIYQKWFNVQPPELPATSPVLNSNNVRTGILGSAGMIATALPNLLRGALITLQLTAFSLFLGAIAGSLIALARLSSTRPLSVLARVYIDFFRGTPLLVQIFMIYYGLPALIQELGLTFTLDRLPAAVMALSLNSAAYIAEIVRAGIQSIEPGQAEAAQSLGLGPVQTLQYIIFPQALRRMIPPLGNEFITLLKDTSLVAVIGFEDLFRRGQLIVAENYRTFEIYTAVALIYLALTLLSSQAFSWLERWMNPVKRQFK